MAILVLAESPAELNCLRQAAAIPQVSKIIHAENERQALDLLATTDFDVIVFSLDPAIKNDALGILHRIQNRSSKTPIVVYGSENDMALTMQMLQSGAQDFLLRDENASEKVLRTLRHAIIRERSMHDQLNRAQFDPLTGFPSRTLFKDRLACAIENSRRRKSCFALMLLDLDHFKSVNDSLGHDAGDILLTQVAQRLKSLLRGSDTIARLGGDEFTIILENIHDPAYASAVAEKIINVMSRSFIVDGHEFFTSTSIGIAVHGPGQEERDLLQIADAALYHAKSEGRNTYRFFDEQMNAKAAQRLSLVTNLRHAANRREFTLCYQPQIDLASGDVIGMEALLRWNNPRKGTVPPAQFIPLLEETGLIQEVGRWALAAACRFNKSLQSKGYPPMRVAVNLSPRQFLQTNLAETVCEILLESKLHPQYLLLEITESVLVADVDRAANILQAMRAIGVLLSLDDFGTGYSSLSYIKTFPLHCLKLDRSFLQNAAELAQDAAIVTAIINMGHALGMKVVAEGVETDKQLEFLRQHSCDMAQGYLFGRPMEEREFIDWLRAYRQRTTTPLPHAIASNGE